MKSVSNVPAELASHFNSIDRVEFEVDILCPGLDGDHRFTLIAGFVGDDVHFVIHKHDEFFGRFHDC